MRPRLALAYAALALLAVFGLLYDLGDQPLCADEAETALLALNVLEHGYPKAADETHELTVYQGVDWNEDQVYVFSPWLDEYIAAASFWLFGASTKTARLPFALLSVGTVALLCLLAWRVWRDHELVLTVLFLSGTCVFFLVFARQCRYYAPLMFGQVWAAHGFVDMLRGRPVRGALHVALALTMQFYGSYMAVPGHAMALAVMSLIAGRRHRQLLWAVPAAGATLVALASPWLLYTEPGDQLSKLDLAGMAKIFFAYLAEVHFHIVPLVIFLVPLAAWAWRRRRTSEVARTERSGADAGDRRELVRLWGLVLLLHLVVLSLVPYVRFRYLSPMFPVGILLAAVVLRFSLPGPWLRRSSVVVVGTTNLVAVAGGLVFPPPEQPAGALDMPQVRTAHAPQSTYVRYVRGLLADYTDRVEVISDFLSREAQPGDVVYSPAPEHILWFNTGLPGVDARTHPLAPPDLPEWILPISASSWRELPPMMLTPFVRSLYETIVLNVPASPPGVRRPDPHAHDFFTAPDLEPFVLLHRRRARSGG